MQRPEQRNIRMYCDEDFYKFCKEASDNKMTDKKNIYQKLIEVSKAVGYLKKDKKNTMQGYSYLSEAKIKEVIKKQFEQQGIIFNYSTRSVREYEISPTHKGTKQFCTIAEGSYSFLDSDSKEVIKGHWFGSGSDTGDKGLYKAITGGIKYVLNTNFLIPTGDDPENDGDNGSGGGKTKKMTIKQIKDLFVDYHNGDKEEAKSDYDMFKDMPEEQQQEIIDKMSSKVKS